MVPETRILGAYIIIFILMQLIPKSWFGDIVIGLKMFVISLVAIYWLVRNTSVYVILHCVELHKVETQLRGDLLIQWQHMTTLYY